MSFLTDDALNALLDVIGQNADRLLVHETEPTTYAEATSGVIGEINVDSADYTKSDTAGGRETAVQEKGVVADASGTDAYVAQVDDDNDRLLAVHPVDASAGFTEGLAYNVSGVTIEAQDPA